MSSQPVQVLVCRVVRLEHARSDIVILHLEPEAGRRLDFESGQYASLKFANRPARDYSMANRPGERRLEFHVRSTGTEGASAYAHEALSLGERVAVAGPFGDMRFRPDHAGPIVCIGWGSGLAPMKSIVDTALASGFHHPLRLYYGAREARDLYGVGHFRSLERRHDNFRFIATVERDPPADACPGTPGDWLARDLAEPVMRPERLLAYLAGPPALVEAARSLLAARGVPASNVLADPFFTDEEKRRLGLALTATPLDEDRC
ncbi:MAG TPA: FAD-binding oxidoreductase [Alphaproteobacteria bacterium]|nr:FAD-binding oxidoreductase [Alphaproteobacteria bacterium]